MVARRILVPPVRVRILPRQHKERAESSRFGSFFLYPTRKSRATFGRMVTKGRMAINLLQHFLRRMVKNLCFQNKNLTFAETNELR